MSRIFLSILVIFSLTAGAHAQHRKSRVTSNSVRILKDKPTVYITFVRFGKREPGDTNETGEGVWLRVHNNTRWSLAFDGAGVFSRNNNVVALYYGVERVPESRPIVYRIIPPLPQGSPFDPPQVHTQPSKKPEVDKYINCDVPPGNWRTIDVVSPPILLPPGKSMIFSVPRETLCKNLMLYIEYNYAWEKWGVDEPQHRVYFYGWKLSRNTS